MRSGRARAEVFFAVRGGCTSEVRRALVDATRGAVVDLPPGGRVVVPGQIADDPFPAANPMCRPYEAALAIDVAAEDADGAAVVASRIADAVRDLVQTDLSAAVIGDPIAVIPEHPAVAPARYQYLMRRRHGTSHEQYLRYYRDEHARFANGIEGITGYTQVHVDLSASLRLAATLGFGVWAIDSVTELGLHSVPGFLEVAARSAELAAEAAADEEIFVDRANSVSFASSTLFSSQGGA